MININQSENPTICSNEDNFILQKSDIKSNIFDVLIFARRNINNAMIPDEIKKIAPYSFENCSSLKHVDFSIDSKLNAIDSYAFKNSSLTCIEILPHIIEIHDGAFAFCENLIIVEITGFSQLNSIRKSFFDSSPEIIMFQGNFDTKSININAFPK